MMQGARSSGFRNAKGRYGGAAIKVGSDAYPKALSFSFSSDQPLLPRLGTRTLFVCLVSVSHPLFPKLVLSFNVDADDICTPLEISV